MDLGKVGRIVVVRNAQDEWVIGHKKKTRF
jgi:hypothetical protein